MEINLLRELVTVLSFLTFLGVVAYAVYPGNKTRFEEAARLPLDEETTLSPTLSHATFHSLGARGEGGHHE